MDTQTYPRDGFLQLMADYMHHVLNFQQLFSQLKLFEFWSN